MNVRVVGTAAVILLGAGAAVASAGPKWCKRYKADGEVFPDQVKNAFDSYKSSKQVSQLPEIAGLLCGRPDERYAAEVLAVWEKETGLAEADAIASLEERVSATFESDHAATCAALGQPDGQGEKRIAAQARAKLLGCENSDRDDAWWMSRADNRAEDVLPLLDAGAADRDELVRLAWVLGEVRHMMNPNESGPLLANYAVAQFDMKALDNEAALKQVAASFKGDRYARIAIVESLAWTRMQIARVEAGVANKTRDPVWRNLIITAPQKGYAEWNAAAAANKAMLAHAATDCATLRKDVTSLIKPVNKGDLAEIEGSLEDNPIAGVMIARYAACLEDQGNDGVSKAATILAEAVPEIAGPRQAAFVATRNALAAIKRAPFDAWHDMSEPEQARYIRTGADFGSLSRGVVQTTKPAKGGALAVKFASDKYRYTVVDCKETNKIDRVLPDGKVEYRKSCKEAGTAIGDNAPEPATVPAGCTTAVAKGRFVFIWDDIPWLIYTDKSRKKIVAAYCIPFE